MDNNIVEIRLKLDCVWFFDDTGEKYVKKYSELTQKDFELINKFINFEKKSNEEYLSKNETKCNCV